MTSTEFNQKWVEFLEPGHYGLAINSPSHVEYLDKLFEGLTKIPGFKYQQIKEKFNWASFYSNLNEVTSPEIGKIIQLAVQQELDFLSRVESEIQKRKFNDLTKQ